MIGTLQPTSAKASSTPISPAFRLRVSCVVSSSSTSTPPERRPDGLRPEVADQLLERDAARHGDRPGSSAPSSPATNRGRSGVENLRRRLAGEPRRLRVDLERLFRQAVLGQDQRRPAEGVRLDHVRAGLEVALVHPAHDVRPGQDEVLVAPSNSSPPKSAAVRFSPWSQVPVAPSRRGSAARGSPGEPRTAPAPSILCWPARP